MSASQLFPQIGADFNASKTFFSKNGPLFVGTSLTGGLNTKTGLPFQIQIPQIQNLFNSLFDVSWEIDLFGKIRRGIEAADALIGSSIAQRDDILLSVLAEVASNYIDLRFLQTLGVLTGEEITLIEEKLALEEERFASGLDNQLDVDTLEAQLSTARAKLPEIQAQIYRAIYALSILVGEFPETLLGELLPIEPLPNTPTEVAVGVRSDLLRRRPDIREAERQLAAATAHVGVAIASFYPTINLGGDIGLQALKIANLFQGRSKTWSIGGDIHMPIFQGGRLVGNLRATEAATVAAGFTYQQTVLNALQEAESTLAKYQNALETAGHLETTVEKEKSLVTLTTKRHTEGLDDALNVIDSERKLKQAEQLHLHSRATSLSDLILLYKALGGGWEILDPCSR